jgi:hypothetical protein
MDFRSPQYQVYKYTVFFRYTEKGFNNIVIKNTEFYNIPAHTAFWCMYNDGSFYCRIYPMMQFFNRLTNDMYVHTAMLHYGPPGHRSLRGVPPVR